MNPKVIIIVLFAGVIYYYLDAKNSEEAQMQQHIAELKQQVDVKEQLLKKQEAETKQLVEEVAKQVNESKQQSEKINQQLTELNKVSQELTEKQELEKSNRREQQKLQALQKKRSEQALRATYISQGFQTMSSLKQQIVEFYMANGRFPRNNRELNIARPKQFATEAIRSIWVSRGGKISVVYTEKSGVDKGTISLTPKVKNQQVNWKCSTKDFADISQYFPQCRVI